MQACAMAGGSRLAPPAVTPAAVPATALDAAAAQLPGGDDVVRAWVGAASAPAGGQLGAFETFLSINVSMAGQFSRDGAATVPLPLPGGPAAERWLPGFPAEADEPTCLALEMLPGDPESAGWVNLPCADESVRLFVRPFFLFLTHACSCTPACLF